jgi:hypothetical protein
MRRAGGGNHDIGDADDVAQAARGDVRDCHRAFAFKQQHGDGFAHDVGLFWR